MAWTTPRTWENGTPPTAAMFNTDIRDNTTELYNNTLNAANKWASTSTTYTNSSTNITVVRGAEITSTGFDVMIMMGGDVRMSSTNELAHGCRMYYAVGSGSNVEIGRFYLQESTSNWRFPWSYVTIIRSVSAATQTFRWRARLETATSRTLRIYNPWLYVCELPFDVST